MATHVRLARNVRFVASEYFPHLRRYSSNSQRHRLAITRALPSSFTNAVTKFASSDDGPISMNKAQTQLEQYLCNLEQFVSVVSLPALDDHADSVFVEDTVVAIGNKAVITNPGHPSRLGEVDSIREFLLGELGYETIDMRENDSAFCDGGDVLYTGRHLFVGLSERTNQDAVKVLAKAFGMEVIAVPFEGQALHLKSIVTHMDESTLLAPTGILGDEVLRAMKAEELGYTSVRLPSMLACNVVAVNNAILAQDTGCKESKRLLLEAAKARKLDIEFLTFSEFAKCDGALTCCSILLER